MSDLASIQMIVFDVDGVLTDGSITIDDHGAESKRFYVRDGLGFKAATQLGVKIGVLSSRSAPCVTLRMTELGVELLIQGVSDKAMGLETLCQLGNVTLEETAFVGDDLVDLPALLRCGYPVAVNDAVEEVKSVAKFITTARGGRGAAREIIEHVLKSQPGRWDELLERYGV